VFQITDDPAVEVSQLNSGDVMKTVEKLMPQDGVWDFPAASVSALELELGSLSLPRGERSGRLGHVSPVGHLPQRDALEFAAGP
jgi:hypothetical protein